MSDDVDRTLDSLPAPAVGPDDAPGRGVGRLAALLVGIGWLGGAAVLGMALVSAWSIHGGEPDAIPFGLLDDLGPTFRDHPSVYAIVVGVGGLLLAALVVIVIAGLGHLLRVVTSLERGVRRLSDRLEDRLP